jgi:DeoR/GlpR family transcriptional regulator of sugar metabolism
MMPSERQETIVSFVSEAGFVSITALRERFGVSIETIRRDISALDRDGRVLKVYGGIKSPEPSFGEPSMEFRLRSRQAQKQAIATRCCAFVESGDTVFVDSGSTTFLLAKRLKERKDITVITNSIPVVNELMGSNLKVILIGGLIRHEESSVVNMRYLFNFDRLNIQKCFIGAGGITANGVSDYNMQEADTRRQIMERSGEVYIAADGTKIGRDVTVKIASLDEIACVVSDREADPATVRSIAGYPCRIELV